MHCLKCKRGFPHQGEAGWTCPHCGEPGVNLFEHIERLEREGARKSGNVSRWVLRIDELTAALERLEVEIGRFRTVAEDQREQLREVDAALGLLAGCVGLSRAEEIERLKSEVAELRSTVDRLHSEKLKALDGQWDVTP